MENQLIAIIRNLTPKRGYTTDFYFKQGDVITEVNETLYKMIQAFNKKTKDSDFHLSAIPYSINKSGSLTYSFGCGQTHFLQQSMFKDLVSVNPKLAENLPLDTVKSNISVFNKDELDLAVEKFNFEF